jgi:ubiquinone biosynthesis protein COQ9
MRTTNESIKDAILESALPDIPFDGWGLQVIEKAAENAGYPRSMVASVFPGGIKDVIIHFSSWTDRRMLAHLRTRKTPDKIRARISLAVRTRLEILAAHKEAERLAIAYWFGPFKKWDGAKLVWKTADAIWDWAGDTSADYNRYTKRALLSGVLSATTLFWLSDTSAEYQDSWAFLDRRIENVLSVGKIVGRLKTA